MMKPAQEDTPFPPITGGTGDRNDGPGLGAHEVASSPPPASERLVLFFSGGGYRAALAAMGALAAVGALGRWADVRKIVSVSGGGILNGWLMKERPESDSAMLDTIARVLDRLMNRRRSARNIIIAAGSGAAVVAGVTVGSGIMLGQGVSPWLVLPLGVLVVAWSIGWLVPNIFLALDFSFARGLRGSSLRDTPWQREHVFVATDLLAGGPVSFVCHRQGALVDVARRGVFSSDRVPMALMLRASAALPPLLPAVRLRLSQRAPGTIEPPHPSVPRGRTLRLVDGGVTGNLGIQADSSVTRRRRRFEDDVRAARLVAAESTTLHDRAQEGIESIQAAADLGVNVAAHGRRSREEFAFQQSPEGRAALKAFLADGAFAGNLRERLSDGLTPEGEEARERFSRAFDDFAVEHGYKDARFWAEADEIASAAGAPALPPEREPNCGHEPIAWSSCEVCETSVVVVDASGAEPRPTRLLRFLMWIPAVAALVNASQTLRVQYAHGLEGDRSVAQNYVVSATSARAVYRRVARVEAARTAFARRTRWRLAEDILPAANASLSPGDVVQAQAATYASRLPTALTAPRGEEQRAAAFMTITSAFIGTYLRLSPEAEFADIVDAVRDNLPVPLQAAIIGPVSAILSSTRHDREAAIRLRQHFLSEVRATYTLHKQAITRKAESDEAYRAFRDAMFSGQPPAR